MRARPLLIAGSLLMVALSSTGVAGGQPARPAHVTRAATPAKPVGRLALVTKAGGLEVVTVRSDGSVRDRRVIGPVGPAPKDHKIVVSDLVASGDGRWLAWAQGTKQPGFGESTRLVLRNMATNRTVTVTTAQAPVGFAGDTLVTSATFNAFKRLVLTPKPHFVAIPLPKQAADVLTVSRRGLIAIYIPRTNNDKVTQRLIAVSLAGKVTTLRSYPDTKANDIAPIESGWVSPDGRHLVIEHGDHTDFGGVGPTSRADELSPNARSTPVKLGHPGTAAAERRMEQTTFAGSDDAIYTVWMTAKSSPPHPAVYRYTRAGWKLVLDHAPLVAGSATGYVVAQPGKYVQVPHVDFPAYDAHATGHAVLVHGASKRSLAVSSAEFVWL